MHPLLRFVFGFLQVDEDESGDDGETAGDPSATITSSHSSSSRSVRFSREMLARRLKKRARAWKIFLAVMQEHGLRVRKYHRRGKGWAHRVVKYDPALPGLRWKTSKWWGAGGGQVRERTCCLFTSSVFFFFFFLFAVFCILCFVFCVLPVELIIDQAFVYLVIWVVTPIFKN